MPSRFALVTIATYYGNGQKSWKQELPGKKSTHYLGSTANEIHVFKLCLQLMRQLGIL